MECHYDLTIGFGMIFIKSDFGIIFYKIGLTYGRFNIIIRFNIGRFNIIIRFNIGRINIINRFNIGRLNIIPKPNL